jgi:dynein heavy chain
MIPENYDIQFVMKKYPLEYWESMNTVLIQEIMRYNKLLDIIRNSLRTVIDCVEGVSLTTNEI